MEHRWVKFEMLGESEATAICRSCNAKYRWHQTRPVDGCRGMWEYMDPDTTRPPVDERIRQELGFGFNNEYDRDAS